MEMCRFDWFHSIDWVFSGRLDVCVCLCIDNKWCDWILMSNPYSKASVEKYEVKKLSWLLNIKTSTKSNFRNCLYFSELCKHLSKRFMCIYVYLWPFLPLSLSHNTLTNIEGITVCAPAVQSAIFVWLFCCFCCPSSNIQHLWLLINRWKNHKFFKSTHTGGKKFFRSNEETI